MVLDKRRVREMFPGTRKVKYFFNGGICMMWNPVRKAIDSFADAIQTGFTEENREAFDDNVSESYRLLAGLIGASPDEIVGVPNTTTGMGEIAQMINPRRGSNVVFDDLEYQTIFPFAIRKKQGVRMKVVRSKDGEMDLSAVEKAVDDKTSAVVVSSVSCWNGYRYDIKALAEVAHRHGAYLVLDGAQMVGAVQTDFGKAGVDFMSTCAHKWLLVTPGIGFMYVRKSLIGEFDPPLPGWRSVVNPGGQDVWNYTFPKTAQRFETGAPTHILLAAARASLEEIQRIGLANIESEILDYSGYLIEGLEDIGVKVCTPAERAQRAGLVTFLLKKHEPLYRTLKENNFVTYHHPPPVVKNMRWPMGGIRVDPSFFNTMEEIDELLRHVREYA